MTYRISFWINLKELRYKVGKLTENFEEKMGITSLWPWPLTQGHQIHKGLSQCGKHSCSENCVQIGASVRLEFCSQEMPDRQTHTHTHRDKLKWKYNPSTISWRCKNQQLFFCFTPLRNRGIIFSLQRLFVCVCASISEQNFSWTDAPIWMRFSLNGCLLHWLRP